MAYVHSCSNPFALTIEKNFFLSFVYQNSRSWVWIRHMYLSVGCFINCSHLDVMSRLWPMLRQNNLPTRWLNICMTMHRGISIITNDSIRINPISGIDSEMFQIYIYCCFFTATVVHNQDKWAERPPKVMGPSLEDDTYFWHGSTGWVAITPKMIRRIYFGW